MRKTGTKWRTYGTIVIRFIRVQISASMELLVKANWDVLCFELWHLYDPVE